MPSRRNVCCLVVGIAAMFLVMAARTTLWDRDEPRFATAAAEMLRSGQYLYPTTGGEVRAQKPILIYWLMTLSMSVLGVGELGARFWAPIAMGITAGTTYVIGARMISARAGLLAMLTLVLNPLSMVEGAAATADAVLLAFITLALAAFAVRVEHERSPGSLVLFVLSSAAAMLTKGPVGLMPIGVVAGTLWSMRRDRPVVRLAKQFGAAFAVAVILFLVWAIPANAAAGGRFYTQGVQHDIITRVLTPLEGHGGNPLLWLPFYPLVVALGFAPWTAVLPAVMSGWRHSLMSSRMRALTLWWIVVPLGAFSLSATHLPHYIFPMWPALALATGALLDRALSAELNAGAALWLRRGAVIAVAWSLALAVLLAAPYVVFGITASPLGLLFIYSLTAATATAFLTFVARPRERALMTTFGVMALLQVSIAAIWLPSLEREKPVPRLARVVRAHVPRSADIATMGFAEPSLDFYLGTAALVIRTPEQLQSWIDAAGPRVLITTRAAMPAVAHMPLSEIGSAGGINIANGERVELVALERAVR